MYIKLIYKMTKRTAVDEPYFDLYYMRIEVLYSCIPVALFIT